MVGAEQNEKVVRESIDAFNNRDWERFRECCTDDCLILDVGTGESYQGHDGWMAFNTRAVEAFPDCTLELTQVVANERFVTTECTFRGTQTGELRMQDGKMPATGREVVVKAAGWFPMEGGKIAAYKRYSDMMAFLAQLGLKVNVG